MSKLTVYCPACGSDEIITTRDVVRNLDIIGCDKCGEMYAIRLEDLSRFGIKQVIWEWHESYKQTKRLESGVLNHD